MDMEIKDIKEGWKTTSEKRADNVLPGYLKSTLCTMGIDWALKHPQQGALDIDAFVSPKPKLRAPLG